MDEYAKGWGGGCFVGKWKEKKTMLSLCFMLLQPSASHANPGKPSISNGQQGAPTGSGYGCPSEGKMASPSMPTAIFECESALKHRICGNLLLSASE
jgi:hypothetical protein